MKINSAPHWCLDILLALTLLSRLPMPHLPTAAFENGSRAVWAYPIAGAIIGCIVAAIGAAAMGLGVPSGFAAGVMLGAGMVITGAMHEDGLADTADGFWGGFTVQRRLEIMKDSHIGTYGVLALLVVSGLRWMAYAALLPSGVVPVIAAAALSRAGMPCLMAGLPHARTDGLSHSVGRPGAVPVAIGFALAASLAGLCVGGVALPAVVAVVVVSALMGALAVRKITGQTGDVLGATQQLCELTVLAVLISHMA
ncbi:adenosylcobinamide-GDP ribazoletransferase [Roseobacter sp.]|uniref:adenosylcobinamide-GDP ribazoletransferase n=1 Tax=Roseobacter sp. TaxID=1907202 RepID=UPI003296CDAF